MCHSLSDFSVFLTRIFFGSFKKSDLFTITSPFSGNIRKGNQKEEVIPVNLLISILNNDDMNKVFTVQGVISLWPYVVFLNETPPFKRKKQTVNPYLG
jgi:hypothetical protein